MPAAVSLDYKIRTDFYVKVLCENKNKPELKCKGSCQMRRAMRNGSKAADEFTGQFKLAPATSEIISTTIVDPIVVVEQLVVRKISHPEKGYDEPHVSTCWQPPCV